MDIQTLSLSDARCLIAGAEAQAEAIGRPVCIAVVGHGGNLISFARMDKAWIGSINIAVDKAYTARAFDMPSANLGEVAQPGAPAYGIQHSNGGRVMVFKGGYPVLHDDVIVGAIGVSGGYGDEDKIIAEAGINALLEKGQT